MKRPTLGPGGIPLPYNQLSEQDLDELASYNPTLTYGQAKQAPPEEFVPAYVAFDKKVVHYFFIKHVCSALVSLCDLWTVSCTKQTLIEWNYLWLICTLIYCALSTYYIALYNVMPQT